jgi:putative transposase
VHERRFKKPLRYKGHDYRAPCCVHVTICTHGRQPLFGVITRDGMSLNNAGNLTESVLLSLHSDEAGIAIDTHVVMPDHLHAIIVLGTNPSVDTVDSIPDVVRRFKMRVMRAWPKGIAAGQWSRYDTHLWHPSYYDTLIRNDTHLEQIREYILANPGRWIERMESGDKP